MADTTFIDQQTTIVAAWLNDTNTAVYKAASAAAGTKDRKQIDWNTDYTSVLNFPGVDATGATDSYAGIMVAITFCLLTGRALYFPVGVYRVDTALLIPTAMKLFGDGPIATTIMGHGLGAGVYVVDFNCNAVAIVEHVIIEGLTIRSNDGVPNALRLKNVAYASLTDVVFYGVVKGCVVDGTRCFTHSFINVEGYSCSTNTVAFAATFNGGGQFTYTNCTFVGATGFTVPANAILDGLAFAGCNWENCTAASLSIFGTCGGVSVAGGRTEGCLAQDFYFRPFGAAEFVEGISITGVTFGASNSGGVSRIIMGGDSGLVKGFLIAGNVVKHGSDLFAANLVALNGGGEAGLVTGNLMHGTTGSGAGVINAQRPNVVVFGNQNLSGGLAEWWGSASAGWTTSTFTATATGMTASITGTAKYTISGNQVTLDLPALVGTSNTTACTITGLPAAIQPASGKGFCVVTEDNTVITVSQATLSAGTLTLLKGTTPTALFTNVGTKGLPSPVSLTYTLA